MSVATRITTLLGTGTSAGARIFVVQITGAPAAPYIIFQPIVATPINTHEEVATLSSTLVQVSCYGRNYDEAQALRAQAIALLEGHHPEGAIYAESYRDGYEDAVSLHRADADFAVWNGS